MPSNKRVSGYIARLERFFVGVDSGICDRKTLCKLAHGYPDGKAFRRRIDPEHNAHTS